MNKTDVEYLRIKASLINDLEDDEFLEWLKCDDCIEDDYRALMNVLEENEMYDRSLDVYQYLEKLKK